MATLSRASARLPEVRTDLQQSIATRNHVFSSLKRVTSVYHFHRINFSAIEESKETETETTDMCSLFFSRERELMATSQLIRAPPRASLTVRATLHPLLEVAAAGARRCYGITLAKPKYRYRRS